MPTGSYLLPVSASDVSASLADEANTFDVHCISESTAACLDGTETVVLSAQPLAVRLLQVLLTAALLVGTALLRGAGCYDSV